MSDDPKEIIESEVLDVQAQQRELEQLQMALSQNEQFTRFMELTKAVNTKMAEVRAHVEAVMVPAYQAGQVDKSLKGDWGSVTVTESDEFDVDVAALPKELKKTVPDMGKIKDHYHLHGKVPKGATYKGKRYGIMLKLK